MEAGQFESLLSQFDETSTDLEAALTPLLSQPLSTLTQKLPLLERAKCYTLTTYAILSLLFSTLKLNDVEAKTHPVFTELTRCRQYFEKIKETESAHEKKVNGGEQRRLVVDKEAAGRFVRAGVGNERRRAGEREGEEKKKAKAEKRRFEEVEQNEAEADAQEDVAGKEGGVQLPETPATVQEEPAKKERKRGKKHKKKHDAPKSSGQAMQALMGKSEKGSGNGGG